MLILSIFVFVNTPPTPGIYTYIPTLSLHDPLPILEVVLGIDNLIFFSILSNKLPEGQRSKVRRIGISLALIMRLALLSMIAWIVGMTAPVFDLGIKIGRAHV